MAAQSFLPRADAPGVVWINDGAARVFSVAQADGHRNFLLGLAEDSDAEASAAKAAGNEAIADLHRCMADGFRAWASEIAGALAAPRHPALRNA